MGRKSKFDAKFRADAVALVRSSDRPRCRIAAELGVSDATIVKWVKEHEQHSDDTEPLSETERAELVRLRSEVRGLKNRQAELVMEREILKKATAFWVNESNG